MTNRQQTVAYQNYSRGDCFLRVCLSLSINHSLILSKETWDTLGVWVNQDLFGFSFILKVFCLLFICMYVCICSCLHMCLKASGDSGYLLSPVWFFRQFFLTEPTIYQLGWPTTSLDLPVLALTLFSLFLCAEVTGWCHHTQLLRGFWSHELRSSCSHGRHFTEPWPQACLCLYLGWAVAQIGFM